MLVKNDEFLNDGCRTPPWLFAILDDQVRALTGQGFQLDAAACAWNAQCPVFFDERMDALRQDWSRYVTIFVNPPFNATLIAQFVYKALEAADHGCTVVLLLPYWPGYSWFQDLKRRGPMQDIIGPVAFERPDGSRLVLNKGRNATQLVAITLGPKVTPGTNGEPITKPQSATWSPLIGTGYQPKLASAGWQRTSADLPVLTCYQANNDYLMAQVARLYFRPGDRIADVTYGRGVFWRQIDLTQFDFHASDLLTVPDHPYDFRSLPYRSADFDVHVFDPPYMSRPNFGRPRIHKADYRNAEATRGFSHEDIMQLYRDGMAEGQRILRPGGLMLVKCKDEIEGGRQRRSHIEIYDIALNELGMEDRDLFVLMQKQPVIHFGRSQHARKNHSYLCVFRKQAP